MRLTGGACNYPHFRNVACAWLREDVPAWAKDWVFCRLAMKGLCFSCSQLDKCQLLVQFPCGHLWPGIPRAFLHIELNSSGQNHAASWSAGGSGAVPKAGARSVGSCAMRTSASLGAEAKHSALSAWPFSYTFYASANCLLQFPTVLVGICHPLRASMRS